MVNEEKTVNLTSVLKERYKEQLEKNGAATLFITVMSVMMFLCIICAIITQGSSFLYMLHPNLDYVFMDHFSMVTAACDHPYTEQAVIYPPLIMTLYGIIGHFTIPYVSGEYERSWDLALAMRDTEMPMMAFIVLILALVISFYIIYQKYVGNEIGQSRYNIVFITLLFSYPVLFGLSTGNCIFLSVLCCILYIYCYDSENKWIRLFSYICLGVAAGVKITPALLAILTLKHRGWLEFGKCFVIVAALFLIPFIFTDGDPMLFISNTLSYASSVPSTFGILNINDMMDALGAGITMTIGVEILVMGIFFLFILMDDKMEKWEEATLLGALLMLVFSVSVSYTFLYMEIGLMLLLATGKKLDKGAIICVVCFVGIFALMPGFSQGQTYVGTMRTVFMLVMVIYLLYRSAMRMMSTKDEKTVKNRKSKKKTVKTG